MTSTLKRIITVLIFVACAELTMFISLVFTHYSAAAASDTPAMTVSDLVYVAPAKKIGVITKEDAAKKIAKTAKKKGVVKSEEIVAMFEADVAETETNPAETAEPETEVTEVGVAEAETEEPGLGPDGLVPYDGSGKYNANLNEAWHSGNDFMFSGGDGYDDESGFSFTWYSEKVLPGGGLDIPGRHVGDENYVYDEDGRVCLASSYLPKGTVVDIPFGGGTGVVYDSGCDHNVLDVYVSW